MEKPLYYGAGNTPFRGALTQPAAGSRLGNGSATLPQYWSTAGYGALGISQNGNQSRRCNRRPMAMSIGVSPAPGLDLYLVPARTLYGLAAGRCRADRIRARSSALELRLPAKPLGLEGQGLTSTRPSPVFRQDQLPVDAFILDFEWYTPKPDYVVPAAGDAQFVDFDWNPKLLPSPAQQIADFQRQGLRVLGIRKPRLGNAGLLAMARAKTGFSR